MVAKLLFNIHDLALILVIAACLMQACILGFQKQTPKHNIFLSLFLVSIAVAAFDSLIYWSGVIKTELLVYSPHIFFVLKASIFLQAPLLFFYIKSVIYREFYWHSRVLIHLLPALMYLLAIPLIYRSLGPESLEAGIYDYAILFDDPVFRFFMWASKLSYIGYGFLALWALKTHKQKLEDAISNTDGVSADWLRLLVIGFVCLWLWGTLAQVLTQINLSGHMVSLIKNYLYLLLVVTLVFQSLSRASNTHRQDASEPDGLAMQSYTAEHVRRLRDAMVIREVYLDPDLSLAKLAKITSLPTRLLSLVINHHFNQNFFEFVNNYRVEHAKRLLSGDDKTLSMIDVMVASGFNSKSAFNRFFKKATDMTPTQYRNFTAPERDVGNSLS